MLQYKRDLISQQTNPPPLIEFDPKNLQFDKDPWDSGFFFRFIYFN